MRDNISKEISEKITDKNVVLFWSGGFESTYLLKQILQSKLYNNCSLDVISILFPRDIYDYDKVESVKEALSKRGIGVHFFYPETVMDKKAELYSVACLKCKTVRREVIHEYLKNTYKNEPRILITGHNLDDLASYLLENITVKLDLTKAENKTRFLETTNKFCELFKFSEDYTLYRPLTRYTKCELEQNRFGELDKQLAVIKEKCYWSNQRKRLLQYYLRTSGVLPDYDRTLDTFNMLFTMPNDEEYRELPVETYLM